MSTIAKKKVKRARDITTADPVKKLILQRITELEGALTALDDDIERERNGLTHLTTRRNKKGLELKRLLSEIGDGIETDIDLTGLEAKS